MACAYPGPPGVPNTSTNGDQDNTERKKNEILKRFGNVEVKNPDPGSDEKKFNMSILKSDEDCFCGKPNTQAAAFRIQGNKWEQQDFYCISSLANNMAGWTLYGVFDGHGRTRSQYWGGAAIAEYCSTHLVKLLGEEKMPTSAKAIVERLWKVFEKCCEEYLNEKCCEEYLKQAESGDTVREKQALAQGQPVSLNIGTTATLVLMNEQKKRLIIANLGDSGTVYYSKCSKGNGGNWKEKHVTKFHSASDEDEKKKLEKCGLTVTQADGVWRMEGISAYSRSLGEFALTNHKKKAKDVLYTPDVYEDKLNPSDQSLLVLASDGLWGVLKKDTVVSLTLYMVDEGMSAQDISKSLAYWALYLASFPGQVQDNISVLVILLNRAQNCRMIAGSQAPLPPPSYSEVLKDDNIKEYIRGVLSGEQGAGLNSVVDLFCYMFSSENKRMIKASDEIARIEVVTRCEVIANWLVMADKKLTLKEDFIKKCIKEKKFNRQPEDHTFSSVDELVVQLSDAGLQRGTSLYSAGITPSDIQSRIEIIAGWFCQMTCADETFQLQWKEDYLKDYVKRLISYWNNDKQPFATIGQLICQLRAQTDSEELKKVKMTKADINNRQDAIQGWVVVSDGHVMMKEEAILEFIRYLCTHDFLQWNKKDSIVPDLKLTLKNRNDILKVKVTEQDIEDRKQWISSLVERKDGKVVMKIEHAEHQEAIVEPSVAAAGSQSNPRAGIEPRSHALVSDQLAIPLAKQNTQERGSVHLNGSVSHHDCHPITGGTRIPGGEAGSAGKAGGEKGGKKKTRCNGLLRGAQNDEVAGQERRSNQPGGGRNEAMRAGYTSKVRTTGGTGRGGPVRITGAVSAGAAEGRVKTMHQNSTGSGYEPPRRTGTSPIIQQTLC